jgi:hypothetical protein
MAIRPLIHLQTAGKLYPNAWRQADEFRQSRGKDIPNFPNWCYLPMAASYAIVSADAGVDRLPFSLIEDVSKLAALSAWRVTQGIYRFDDVFEKALIDSPITGDLPVEVLYRLPEWCIYIETPNYQYLGENLHGFFAHLEWDVNTQRSELRFLFDCDSSLIPIIFHIGNWTVIEAIDRGVSEAAIQLALANMPITFDPKMELVELIGLQVRPLLSLVLYLCSEKPEYVGGLPSRPQPKKTKNGWRLFPPDKPKIIHVGKSIGDSLRAASVSENESSDSSRSIRPHIRRGHWHGYWIGKKSSENSDRKFVYRWLAPMGVNTTPEAF